MSASHRRKLRESNKWRRGPIAISMPNNPDMERSCREWMRSLEVIMNSPSVSKQIDDAVVAKFVSLMCGEG